MQPATYTYAEVAQRLEQVFGVRPSLSSLRAASAKAHQKTDTRVRITAAMPAPLPGAKGQPARFDAEQIESWLAHHPRKAHLAHLEQLEAMLADPQVSESSAVAFARSKALSWGQIAEALDKVRQITYPRTSLHGRYRHLLTDQGSQERG